MVVDLCICNFDCIKRFIPIMNRFSRKMLRALAKEGPGRTFYRENLSMVGMTWAKRFSQKPCIKLFQLDLSLMQAREGPHF